jgi:hypothetical protein
MSDSDSTDASPVSEPEKRSGCAKRLFYAFLCGVLMLVGAYVFLDWSGKKRWEETRARLEKEGLPMERRQLERPDVPPKENFGESPLMRATAGLDGAEGQERLLFHTELGQVFQKAATKKINAEGMKDFRATMTKSRKWPIPSAEQEPDDTKAILAALRELDDQMGELVSDAKRPHALLPHDLPPMDDSNGGMPPSGYLKFSKSLRLLIYCHLHSGDVQRATDLIRVQIRVAEIAGASKTLVAVLTSRAIVSLGLSSIQSGFDLHRWKESQLLEFVDVVQKHPPPRYADTMRLEWLFLKSEYEKAAFLPEFDTGKWRVVPKGLGLQAKSDHAEIMHALIKALETGGLAEALRETERISKTESAQSKIPWIRFPYASIPVYQRVFQGLQYREFSAAAIRIQLALEQHFLQHGSYPNALTELVPAKIESIPADLDGKPLRYLLEVPDRYVIWSIGSNGVDDWSGDWLRMRSGDLNNAGEASDWLVTLPSLTKRFEEKETSEQNAAPRRPNPPPAKRSSP